MHLRARRRRTSDSRAPLACGRYVRTSQRLLEQCAGRSVNKRDQRPASRSSRNASNSAAASMSRGRPAARFVRISHSRSMHRYWRPNSSTDTVCDRSDSYPPPVISPSRSMSPIEVVSVTLSVRRSGRRPIEWTVRRSAARVWSEGTQRVDYTRQVGFRPCVHNFDILRETARAVHGRR